MLAGILLLCVACAVSANNRVYLADLHQSHWNLLESKLECGLIHQIPGYGVAQFKQLAGEELSFSLSAFKASNRSQSVVVDSAVPEWKHNAQLRNLGSADDNGTNLPFTLPRVASLRLLYELESGMRPAFSYKDAAEGSEMLIVGLSAVNFRPAHQQFNHCIARLLPFGFEDVHFTNVRFDTNSDQFDEEMRERIDRVVRWVKTDSTVKRIVIGGHADWVGSNLYNSDLSTFRAVRVVDYLTSQGVPEGLIQYASYGEERPLRSNETRHGRAANRRVTMELVRNP